MRTHGFGWAVLVALLGLCVAAAIGALGVARQVQLWCADLPSLDNTDAFNLAEKSTVYAADGETVLAELQIENRTPLDSLDQISQWLIQATLNTEDSRFYEHHGVDYWGLARAVVNNITGGETQGASTITQQLVKNTVLSQEATEMTIKRKVREASLALELEDLYSKDTILLMYLNTINYGDGCYGIEAAAQHYFSKSAADLTMVEAATLAGIPQAPSNLNPVDNPEACLARRNEVLRRMRIEGTVSAEEYAAAIAAPLGLNLREDDSYNGIYLYPYFTSYVRDLLLSQYSAAEIFAGGLSVYTTLDVSAQEDLEQAIADNYAGIPDPLEYAAVALDPRTGHIKAMVGGKDFFSDQFNITTTKGRPTGSTFKMFTLVTAIEQGINPETLCDCRTPVVVTTAQGKHEINNVNGDDYGIVSIARATALSANTGFIRLMLKVTARSVIDTAHRMGVTAELPEVPTLTLGVADITPLEMASAYGVLATGGVRHPHIAITRIVDKSGSTIFLAEEDGTRVLSESIAGAATQVLKGVTAPGGTATNIRIFDRRDVAAKTGSSDDWKDRWAIAYTPSVSVAIWLGDRDNRQAWWKANPCTYVARDFLNAYLEGTPYESFPKFTPPPYNNPYNKEQNIELGKQELKKAPEVVGIKLTTALKDLEGYPVLFVEEYHETVAPGIVFAQKADDKLKEIILYVSKGPDPSPKTAVVTFNANGGTVSGGTSAVRTVLVGDTITLPTPVREGFEFFGWNPGALPAGASYTVSEAVTFVAQWQEAAVEPPEPPEPPEGPEPPVEPDPGGEGEPDPNPGSDPQSPPSGE